MKHILVVGPSGSGKTTLCRKLAEADSQFVHLWLDEEVKKLADVQDHAQILERPDGQQILWGYFHLALDHLNEPNPDPRIGLVDVGAGVLRSEEGKRYLIERGANMVYIACAQEQINQRVQEKLAKNGRNPTSQLNDQATPTGDLQPVYAAARVVINTSLDDVESCINQLKTAAHLLSAATLNS